LDQLRSQCGVRQQNSLSDNVFDVVTYLNRLHLFNRGITVK